MGLSRKPMPPRKQPLRAKKRLAGTSLSQSARAVPVRKPLRSRPKPRKREEVEARRVVAQRSDGRCEGCGRVGPTDYSHRVGAGVGGPWHPANALALDRRCHSWLHARPAEARTRLGWRLESTDNFLTSPAWLYGRGWSLLAADGGITSTIEDEDA